MNTKRNIRLLYAVSFLQGMVFYSSVSTLYWQSAGVTVFQISIIESISLLLSLTLELPWGILAEKIGYKGTIVSCSILHFLSKIIFWKADGFGIFKAYFIPERGAAALDELRFELDCAAETAHFDDEMEILCVLTGRTAEHVFWSKSHFSWEFQKYMGIPFADYLRSLRLNMASYLLENTDKSVLEVLGETVICALGQRLRVSLVEELRCAAAWIAAICDAARVSTITNAFYWGYHAALHI